MDGGGVYIDPKLLFDLFVHDFPEWNAFACGTEAACFQVAGVEDGVAAGGPGAMTDGEMDGGSNSIVLHGGMFHRADDAESVTASQDVAFLDAGDPVVIHGVTFLKSTTQVQSFLAHAPLPLVSSHSSAKRPWALPQAMSSSSRMA